MVADKVADMELDMVADMEVDMVSKMEVNKVADKVSDMVADKKEEANMEVTITRHQAFFRQSFFNPNFLLAQTFKSRSLPALHVL